MPLSFYLVRIKVSSGVLAGVAQLALHVHVEAVPARPQPVDAARDEDAAARLREALHHHQLARHLPLVLGAGHQVDLQQVGHYSYED